MACDWQLALLLVESMLLGSAVLLVVSVVGWPDGAPQGHPRFLTPYGQGKDLTH